MKSTYSTFAQIAMAATFGAGSFLLSIPPAMAEPPAINITEYELNTSSVQQCLRNAEDIMKQEGLENIEVGKSDVFGTRGNTSVELYCVYGGKILMMIIAGQNLEETQEVQSALDKKISQ
jgi:hypothetical protein